MSSAVIHAELMRFLHNKFGIIPNYEDILENAYRGIINPGDVVIDIGAHTGRHTSVFAEIVTESGVVHAFEPLPFAAAILHQRGLPDHVKIHQVALSDRMGQATFVYAEGAPEESGLRRKAYNQPELVTPREITVTVQTLDSLAHIVARVDFMKVDAEGAEVSILRGAKGMINRHRPTITVAYGHNGYSAFGLTAGALYDFALENGYLVGDLFGGICETAAEWLRVCDASYWDWFLVPQERVVEWARKVSIHSGVAPSHIERLGGEGQPQLEISSPGPLERRMAQRLLNFRHGLKAF